jgi:hypothetical protein
MLPLFEGNRTMVLAVERLLEEEEERSDRKLEKRLEEVIFPIMLLMT